LDAASALGEAVAIAGTGFREGDAPFIVSGDQWILLTGAEVKSAERIEGSVPAGTPPGRYDVAVRRGEETTSALEGAFTVYDGELEIRVLDVGQGDAQVIRAPNGRALLVDGGKTGQGTARVMPFLGQIGKPRPEIAVVTHFDNDHLGGIVELLEAGRKPLEALLDHGDNHGCATQTCQRYYELRARDGGAAATPGQRLALGAGVRVTVVAVNGELASGARVATATENENSIALLVEFGGFRYLTAGDLTGGDVPNCDIEGKADVEDALAREVGAVDVLHTNHHGSCASTNAAYVSLLQPRVALVSVGENNAFCHPAQLVLNRLSNAGVRIYLTNPGITTASANCPTLTVLPTGAAGSFGDIMISTRDGAAYRARVLDGANVLVDESY
jgi:beta-lactamase superfamily II metal-dependent hydrolase